jgi:hypothetical protein
MMLPFKELAELVDPDDPYVPWEPLFDVNVCPYKFLPWLGQIVGVRVPRGMPEDDARNFIKDLASMNRGSPEAIKQAIKYALSGSQTVILHERDAGDAYLLEVVTLDYETPDPALVIRYALTQKPGAIKFTNVVTAGWIYQDMTIHYGSTSKKYKDIPAEYTTYSDLQVGP